MIILKFGGTSVSTAESIFTIGNIVLKNRDNKPVIVVSAIKDVTDLLLSLVESIDSYRSVTLRKIKNIHLSLIKQIWHKRENQNIHNANILKQINDISLGSCLDKM